jgi:TonB family protein
MRRGVAAALAIQSLAFTGSALAQLPLVPRESLDQPEPPTLSEGVEPVYPEAAREAGLEATVVVRLSIDEQGQVRDAELVEGAGHGFDEAAQDAALRLKFIPASRQGEPIGSRIRYAFVFKLPPPGTAGTSPPPEATPSVPPPLPAAPPPPSPADVDVRVRGQLSEIQQRQQSAEAIHVLDLRRARQQTADMGEVLARAPGVVVRRDGGLGCGERLSLNGLYDEQVRVFLDGIPLALTGYSCGVSSIPVNLIDRVEVHRGVVPLRLGADALGGAVDFTTDPTYATKASASYQVGSFGVHRATVHGRYRHEPSGFVAGATAFADVARNDYEVDVEIPDDRGRLSPARVPRFHDRYRAVGGNVEVGVLERPWAKRLLVTGFFSGNEKELQHNVVMTVPYGEVRYATRVHGITGRYSVDLPHDVTLEAVAAYSKRTTHFEDQSNWVYNWRGERVRERRIPGEIEADPTDQYSWQDNWFGRVTASWTPRAGHAFSLSTTPQLTHRTGDERLEADPSRDPLTGARTRFSAVSGLEYRLDVLDERLSNIFFVKDYVYRARSEEPLPGGGSKERDSRTHRQGIGNAARYRFSRWLLAKASYEWATRLPGPDEVFGDGMQIRPNLDLEPEVSHNANFGPRVDLMRTPAGDFTLEVNAFWRESDRFVVLLGNDRFFTYQNVYKARSRGLENAATWTAPNRLVSLDGNLTWLSLRNASSEGTFGSFEGDRIPNRPYLTASWGARLRFTGFPGGDDTLEPYYHGRYVHQFYRGWESQGIRELKQVVDAQWLHSAGITWAYNPSYGRFTTSLEVDNFTNARVFDNFGVARPGRGAFLKVTAEL